MLRGILVGVLLLLTQGWAHGHSRMEGHPSVTSRTSHWVGIRAHKAPIRKASNKHSTRHIRRHSLQTRHHAISVLPKNSGDLVTVPTAAGISITVAKKLAPQFQGFVDDLVKLGYTPKHIGCWAPYGTHVAYSNHYHGGACDFDQTGWNRTSTTMYHIGNVATRWGLRDGCSFRRPDCGHVDDGTNIGWKHPNNLIARYINFQSSPPASTQTSKRQPIILENFEE